MRTRDIESIEDIDAELKRLVELNEILFNSDSSIKFPAYNLSTILPKITAVVESLKSSFKTTYGDKLKSDDYKSTFFSIFNSQRHDYKIKMARMWDDISNIQTIPQAIFVYTLWEACLKINARLDGNQHEFGKALKREAANIGYIKYELNQLLSSVSLYWQHRINIVGYVAAYYKELAIKQDNFNIDYLEKNPLPDFYIGATDYSLKQIQSLIHTFVPPIIEIVNTPTPAFDCEKILDSPKEYPEITAWSGSGTAEEIALAKSYKVEMQKKRMSAATLFLLNNGELRAYNHETAFILTAQELTREFVGVLSTQRKELLLSKLISNRKEKENHTYSAITRADPIEDYVNFYKDMDHEPNGALKFNYESNRLDLEDVFVASGMDDLITTVEDNINKYKDALYQKPNIENESLDEKQQRSDFLDAERKANPNIEFHLIPLYREWQSKVNGLSQAFIAQLCTLKVLSETSSYHEYTDSEKEMMELVHHADNVVGHLLPKEHSANTTQYKK